MTYILRFGSPVLTPYSIDVGEGVASSGYEAGPFASAEEAEAKKQVLIQEYLDNIAKNGGESPFWRITPSDGMVCNPPAWVESFGYRAVPSPVSEYYVLVPILPAATV